MFKLLLKKRIHIRRVAEINNINVVAKETIILPQRKKKGKKTIYTDDYSKYKIRHALLMNVVTI